MGWLDGILHPKAAEPTPGFEGITTRAQAMEMHRRLVLDRLCLVPARFGGGEGEENFLYVPETTVSYKNRCDDMIAYLFREGYANRYECVPEFRGESVIPCRVTVRAFDGETQVYGEVLEVW